MEGKKATITAVKSVKVNMRLRDDLKPKVDYLMLFPGGLTKWMEEQLDKVEVDSELMDKLKNLKR
jgi:hypothetical protein